MSILQGWYSGELHPAEEIDPGDRAYRALEEKIERSRDDFTERLSAADREKFEELTGHMLEESDRYAYASFAYGFKLGLLLMHEVMAGENRPSS